MGPLVVGDTTAAVGTFAVADTLVVEGMPVVADTLVAVVVEEHISVAVALTVHFAAVGIPP